MDEAYVIALVREGNTDAFAEIVEQYQTPISRYLYRLMGDREVTQDLVQEFVTKVVGTESLCDNTLARMGSGRLHQ